MKIAVKLFAVALILSLCCGCDGNNRIKESINDEKTTVNSLQSNEAEANNSFKDSSVLTEEIAENMINSFSRLLINGDSLYFRYAGNLVIIQNGKAVKIPLKENNMVNIWDNQIFLSHDKNLIYYSSTFSGINGHLMAYDLNKKENLNLLQKLGIPISGNLQMFSYSVSENKIAAIMQEPKAKKDGTETVNQPVKILMINLNDNTHKFISVPSLSLESAVIRSIGIIENNILISFINKQSQYFLNETVIINENGQVIKELPLRDNKNIYNISLSPDSKKLAYQYGPTTTTLFLYDIANNNVHDIIKKENAIITGETAHHTSCSYINWSSSENILYIFAASTYRNMSTGKFVKTTRDLIVFNTRELKIEAVASIDTTALERYFNNSSFAQ